MVRSFFQFSNHFYAYGYLYSLMRCSSQVGAVLRVAAPADGETSRSNLCITAKLGLDDSAPNKVEAACRYILAETGLDYLDCFVMQPVQSIKVRIIFQF